MSQYKLPCQADGCNSVIRVDASQAGLTVDCPKCGAPQEVPTIRGLSQLEKVAGSDAPEATRKWGPPQSLMTAGMLLFVVCLGAGIALMSISPPHPYDDFVPPPPLDKNAPLREIFQVWQDVHSGLSKPTYGEAADYERAEIARRNWAIASFVVAGLGLVLTLTGWSLRKPG